MKSFDVECPVHGKFEFIVHPEYDENDLRCVMNVNGKCCNEPLKRLYSVPNIHYNGHGFYSTDNGDK